MYNTAVQHLLSDSHPANRLEDLKFQLLRFSQCYFKVACLIEVCLTICGQEWQPAGLSPKDNLRS